MVGPKLKPETARYVQKKYAISASRICRVLGLAMSTFDYKEHPRDDSEAADVLIDLASQNKR